ncbi:MAG: acetate--CoA ligase [Myxococcales bacterium]|nr:acetate--CoA ligase [Myxococcales bacterium]
MTDAKTHANTNAHTGLAPIPPTEAIESALHEDRRFAPPPAFAAAAWLGDPGAVEQLRQDAARDPVAYWSQVARDDLRWMQPFTRAFDGVDAGHARWFDDGTLNLTDNCLDRHCETWRRNKAALIWEGEPIGPHGPEVRTLTYLQLRSEVMRCANALKELGVQPGDRVAIYLPLVPEAAVAMLACARIGAVHSVVFGGFSADALRDRCNDAGAKVIVTADGGWRRGGVLPLKAVVDAALAHPGRTGETPGCPSVHAVVVVERTGVAVIEAAVQAAFLWVPGRDHWWHALLAGAEAECPPAELPAEHPLFILYTSGTTGKPKGILHTTGGYLAHVTRTARWVFDLRDDDLLWCTADVGWVTGHSYVLYGPLSNGATTFLYEGAPATPARDRLWDIVERHRVTILYTAPTALRTFMSWGDAPVLRHDLRSLRLLGTVGEPINPAAWMWYYEVIGGRRCPIVDTWWQTETGGILIAPLPGVQTLVPGSATLPMPGILADVVDGAGNPQPANVGGLLVVRHPWPGMARTIWGDRERWQQTYFAKVPAPQPAGLVPATAADWPPYFTGDGARRDADGNFWIMGRVDDVLNVSGHRIGTMEVESALVSHPQVAEAAVVGRPDALTGQALVAFVTVRLTTETTPALAAALKAHVAHEIGGFARPAEVRFAAALPKTRSGKIMRRLLRELATAGSVSGDTTTLEDFGVLEKLRAPEEEG